MKKRRVHVVGEQGVTDCYWTLPLRQFVVNLIITSAGEVYQTACHTPTDIRPSVCPSDRHVRPRCLLPCFRCALLLISSQASAPTLTLGPSLSCLPSLIFFSSFYSLIPLHSPTSLLDSTPRVPCSWLIVPHGNVFHVEVRDHLLVRFLKFPQFYFEVWLRA